MMWIELAQIYFSLWKWAFLLKMYFKSKYPKTTCDPCDGRQMCPKAWGWRRLHPQSARSFPAPDRDDNYSIAGKNSPIRKWKLYFSTKGCKNWESQGYYNLISPLYIFCTGRYIIMIIIYYNLSSPLYIFCIDR